MNRRLITIDNIYTGNRHRAPDMGKVQKIAESIADVGLMNPPAVVFRDGLIIDGEETEHTPVLIYGLHRILALKSLGEVTVECIVHEVDDLHAELMEIAENLHRNELTALERDSHIARWIELTTVKREVSAQVAPKVGRPESGINAASRELGIERTDAQRAVKVASLSEEAKTAAISAGLDDNRTALLAAAKASTPEAQVTVVKEWNTAREVAAAKASVSQRNQKAAKSEAVDMAIVDFYTAWGDIPFNRRREVLLEIGALAYLEEE